MNNRITNNRIPKRRKINRNGNNNNNNIFDPADTLELVNSLTAKMRKVLKAIPDFENVPITENQDTLRQINEFYRIGANLSSNPMVGGGLSDTIRDNGKNFIIGVYATFLLKPVEKIKLGIQGIPQQLHDYILAEFNKIMRLDPDSKYFLQ